MKTAASNRPANAPHAASAQPLVLGTARYRGGWLATTGLAYSFALALSLGCGDTQTTAPEVALPAAPHPIIVLDIDTLRADRLGTYGYDGYTSPTIDQLAAQGVVFEWTFSQAPNTGPSQASILTGLYPSTHGKIADEDQIPQSVETLAEALRRHGYSAAAFVDGGFMSAEFGGDQGFEPYNDSRGGGLKKIGPKVDRWLAEHAEEDFFLLIHTYDVHTPYAPPQDYQDRFTAGLAAPTPGFAPSPKELEAIRLSRYSGEPRQLSANDLAWASALYDAGIRWVDDWLKGFLERLERLGLLDRATLVVISDHGEEFQEHGSVLHEKLYSTVTRVPLILRPPGGIAGRRISAVVQTIDLMPTLLELAGAAPVAGVQGSSLLPLIRGEQTAGARLAVSESPFFGQRRAITVGDYRLLWTRSSEQIELYRFRDDRAEATDLTQAEPEQAARLRQGLAGWQQMVDQSHIHSAESSRPAAETLEQLRALGYLQ